MTEDNSWLEEGRFSTPRQAAGRSATVRSWARAGIIRHIADGTPTRFLLCDDDVDDLAQLLQGMRRPTLTLVRSLRRWDTESRVDITGRFAE